MKSLGDIHVIREEDIPAKAKLHLNPLGPWHQSTGCALEEIARLMNVSTHPRATPNTSNKVKPTGSGATTPGADSTIYTDPVVLKAMVHDKGPTEVVKKLCEWAIANKRTPESLQSGEPLHVDFLYNMFTRDSPTELVQQAKASGSEMK